MSAASLLGRYAEDVESGNADMESHPACDNHSHDNHDLAMGKRAFSSLSPTTRHGKRGDWGVRANRGELAEYQ